MNEFPLLGFYYSNECSDLILFDFLLQRRFNFVVFSSIFFRRDELVLGQLAIIIKYTVTKIKCQTGMTISG